MWAPAPRIYEREPTPHYLSHRMHQLSGKCHLEMDSTRILITRSKILFVRHTHSSALYGLHCAIVLSEHESCNLDLQASSRENAIFKSA